MSIPLAVAVDAGYITLPGHDRPINVHTLSPGGAFWLTKSGEWEIREYDPAKHGKGVYAYILKMIHGRCCAEWIIGNNELVAQPVNEHGAKESTKKKAPAKLPGVKPPLEAAPPAPVEAPAAPQEPRKRKGAAKTTPPPVEAPSEAPSKPSKAALRLARMQARRGASDD